MNAKQKSMKGKTTKPQLMTAQKAKELTNANRLPKIIHDIENCAHLGRDSFTTNIVLSRSEKTKLTKLGYKVSNLESLRGSQISW